MGAPRRDGTVLIEEPCRRCGGRGVRFSPLLVVCAAVGIWFIVQFIDQSQLIVAGREGRQNSKYYKHWFWGGGIGLGLAGYPVCRRFRSECYVCRGYGTIKSIKEEEPAIRDEPL